MSQETTPTTEEGPRRDQNSSLFSQKFWIPENLMVG